MKANPWLDTEVCRPTDSEMSRDTPMTSLADVARFVRNGKSIKQSSDAEGLPITRIETISNGVVNPEKVGFADLLGGDVDRWLLEPDDILFSHINSLEHIGKTAIYQGKPERLVHGMNLLCIRPNSKHIDSRYLLHALREPRARKRLRFLANKAVNQASISATALKAFQVPLPPLPEQRRIAAILDKADALRQKRREAIAKLDQLLQSVFLEMFGDPVSNEEDWESCQLGDLIHAAKDGPHVSPEYSDAGIPFLSTRHIRAGKIQWTDLKYISKASAEIQWKKCRPEYGDILYTKGGTTGLAAEVDTYEPFAVWVHVAVLKTNHNVADPTWLTAMLNTSYCYAQSQRYTHGIANRDLGLGRMKKIKMYRPPQDLQKKFADYSRSLIEKRVFSYASATALDDLFQSIQQRAFTGQL